MLSFLHLKLKKCEMVLIRSKYHQTYSYVDVPEIEEWPHEWCKNR